MMLHHLDLMNPGHLLPQFRPDDTGDVIPCWKHPPALARAAHGISTSA